MTNQNITHAEAIKIIGQILRANNVKTSEIFEVYDVVRELVMGEYHRTKEETIKVYAPEVAKILYNEEKVS